MTRHLAFGLTLVVLALAAAPVAAGDGPMPFAQQGGPGVLLPATGKGGPVRIVAVPASGGAGTVLETIHATDGQVLTWLDIAGSYGLPGINYWSLGGDSLSRDGRTLVLGKTQPGSPSAFVVYDPKTWRLKQRIALPGSYSFDALSPDATRMYLIQYMLSANGDYSQYVVRAYDLRTNTLLPGRVADRTQKSWVMNGYPLTRVTSADGRWVYTLYQNGGDGYPFVHALDTVRGVAHCIGLPMTNGIYNVELSLRGSTLAVHWRSGRPWLDVDTRTWRVSAAGGGGFSWLWVAIGIAVALGMSATGVAARRHKRNVGFEQEVRGLLDEREAERIGLRA
jgi:hypothetical protein